MKRSIQIMLILCVVATSRARENNWQFTFEDGSQKSAVTMTALEDDSLRLTHLEQEHTVAIKNIAEIKREKKSKFLLGAGAGLLTGGVIGGLLGYTLHEDEPQDDGETVRRLGACREWQPQP